MAYETKDNTGSLFRNDKKSEKAPDYTGTALVNGVSMKMAAWLKTDRNGKTFMSFKFEAKDQDAKAQEFKREAKRVFPDADLNDAVPF